MRRWRVPLVMLVAAAVSAAGLLAWASPAWAFTCPSSSVCMFSNEDLTGVVIVEPDSAIPAGHVFSLTDGTGPADSVRNHSGTDLWIENRQTEVAVCIQPGDWFNSHDYYGFAERTSGTACTEGEPGGL